MLRLSTLLALVLSMGCTGAFSVHSGVLRPHAQVTFDATATATESSSSEVHVATQGALDSDLEWRVTVAADGSRTLVDALGELVMDLEGRPVCLDDEGALYVENQFGAHVDVDLNASFLLAARLDADAALVASNGAAAIDDAMNAMDDAMHAMDGAMNTVDVSMDVSMNASVSLDGATGAQDHGQDAQLATGHSSGAEGGAAAGGVGGSVGVQIAPTEPGQPPLDIGGGAGVTASAGTPHLSGLLNHDGGLAVDGLLTHLDQLGPITHLAPDPGAHVVANANLTVDAHLDGQISGGQANLVVHLRGGEAPARPRGRVRLHLVVDRSSSMQSTWAQVMSAAESLIGHLRADDSIQIVGYGNDAQVVLPTTRVGDGAIPRAALSRISVGGGTNIEAGLEAAYAEAYAAPRHADARDVVILLSDGVPNGGAFGADELGPMAAEAKARVACTTTVVGLGNQFDADVLRAIASGGEGGYHVARDTASLGAVLEAEIDAQFRIAASDLGVRVNLSAGVSLAEGELEHGERVDGGVKLDLPQLRQGEERRLVLRLNISAMVTAGAVAHVEVSHRSGVAALATDRKTVVASDGGGPRAAFAVADADLGRAIDLAAVAVRNGRAAEARRVLEAHVSAAHTPSGASYEPLFHRTQAVGRVAQVVGGLTVSASHSERREVANAMGAIAARLLR